jgi:hypothetical protein
VKEVKEGVMNKLMIGLIAVLLSATAAFSATPQTINYQGVLKAADGTPVTGTVQMQFALYTSPTDTPPLWSEVQSGVTVTAGRYSVVLGSVTPINLPFDQQYYLGVTVGTDPEMTPRLLLSTTPYAFRAIQADSISSSVTLNSANTIVSTVPIGTAPLQIASTTLVPNLNAQMVGGLTVADLDARYSNPIAPRPTPQQIATLQWNMVSCTSGTFTVGNSPGALTFDGSSIWVANFTGSSIQKINPSTGAVGSPITVGNGPIALAFDGTNVWVANYFSNSVQKISPSTSAIVSTITLITDPRIQPNPHPRALAFDGTSLWVAIESDNSVQKINPSTGAVGSPIPVGNLPIALAFDGTSIWVANRGSGSVSKINPLTGATDGGILVAGGPKALAFDGTNMWVANVGSRSVQKFNPSTGAVGSPISLEYEPADLVFDGTSIWVLTWGIFDEDYGYVRKINPSTGMVGSPILVGHRPSALAFDGASIWVTNTSDNTVQKLCNAGVPVGAQTVGGDQIVSGAVGTAQIADGAVTDAKITGPISASKLDLSGVVSKAGDTMTGVLNVPQLVSIGTVSSANFVGNGAGLTGITAAQTNAVSKSGDTMTGTLNLPANGLAVGTNQLLVSGGNVGIGTTAPGAKLDVADSFRVLGTPSPTSPSTGKGLEMNYSSSSNSGLIQAYDRDTSSYGMLSINAAQVHFGGPPGSQVFVTGNMLVEGFLQKGGGSFKIDHPLDPRNKYLYHSFVESPDMMNIYNGNVTTDDKGYSTIVLPDWFEALNKDFRYQLTIIGKDSWARARVSEEIANNRFVIQTDVPNTKVSWQITGIRKDAFADSHRIPVEENKPDNEKGTCLHQEACAVR